jgi:hypothetical protein
MSVSMDAGRLMKAILEEELKPISVMRKPPMMPAPPGPVHWGVTR